MHGLRGILTFAVIGCCAAPAAAQWEYFPTMFVDWESCAETPTGYMWETAFPTIQEALAYASPEYDLIVFVRGSSDPGQAVYSPGDASSDTFLIENRVYIYGGFPGESELEETDPDVYDTILSGGDVNEHVVTMTGDDALLWGFIIEDGYAHGSDEGYHDRGAGVFIEGVSPTVERCLIRNNDAIRYGAGMYIRDGAPAIIDCIFKLNASDSDGGGLCVHNGSPEITGTDFEGNSGSGGGGALILLDHQVAEATGPHFSSCTFFANAAGADGGAGAKLYAPLAEGEEAFDDTEFSNCLFENNALTASGSIGAGLMISGSPLIEDSVFTGNRAWDGSSTQIEINGGGAAVFNYLAGVDPEGPTGPYDLFHTAIFDTCTFRGNSHYGEGSAAEDYADYNNHGGGAYIQRAPPADPFEDTYPVHLDAEFHQCRFIKNVAGNGGGAFFDRAAGLFTDCVFIENNADGNRARDGQNEEQTAGYGGGAISMYRLSYIKTVDCKFVRNRTKMTTFGSTDRSWSGGAIYPYEGSTFHIDRCYFIGNESTNGAGGQGHGGAIWCSSECLDNETGTPCEGAHLGDKHAQCNVYNSVFVANRAAGKGGAVRTDRAGWTKLVNCTVMFNHAQQTGGVQTDSTWVFIDENCWTKVFNCIVWGNTDDNGSWSSGDQRKQIHDVALWQGGVHPIPECNGSYSSVWPRVENSCIESNGCPALTTYKDPTGSAPSAENIDDDPGIPVEALPATWGGDEWTDAAVYDPETGTTTFTDGDADFPNLQGFILATEDDLEVAARSVILFSDDDGTLIVLGNFTDFSYGPYRIEDYAIGDESPCRDTGDNTANATLQDIVLQGRVDDIEEIIDRGCYEYWPEIP